MVHCVANFFFFRSRPRYMSTQMDTFPRINTTRFREMFGFNIHVAGIATEVSTFCNMKGYHEFLDDDYDLNYVVARQSMTGLSNCHFRSIRDLPSTSGCDPNRSTFGIDATCKPTLSIDNLPCALAVPVRTPTIALTSVRPGQAKKLHQCLRSFMIFASEFRRILIQNNNNLDMKKMDMVDLTSLTSKLFHTTELIESEIVFHAIPTMSHALRRHVDALRTSIVQVVF